MDYFVNGLLVLSLLGHDKAETSWQKKTAHLIVFGKHGTDGSRPQQGGRQVM